jgi:hypothetical protein
MGPTAVCPPKEDMQRILIALINPSPAVSFEPVNLESNGKHANYDSTDATFF